jgi:AbrB family looped-hinge helix DNA binding protein
MHVTAKGQVTIPIEVRRQLGILPDTEVEFEIVGDAVVIRKSRVQGRRGRTLVRWLRGRATVAMSTDEILALTRGDRR